MCSKLFQKLNRSGCIVMAASSSHNPQFGAERALTECGICLDTMKKPKALPCDHSFCSKCLCPLIVDRTIKCPQCRKTHRSDSVRPDFRLQQFLDVLKEKEEAHKKTGWCIHNVYCIIIHKIVINGWMHLVLGYGR